MWDKLHENILDRACVLAVCPFEQDDASRIHDMPSHVRGYSGGGRGGGHAGWPHHRRVELHDDLRSGPLCPISLRELRWSRGHNRGRARDGWRPKKAASTLRGLAALWVLVSVTPLSSVGNVMYVFLVSA